MEKWQEKGEEVMERELMDEGGYEWMEESFREN